jgi:hypothetical protein
MQYYGYPHGVLWTLTLAHPAHSRSALTRACEEGACACTCAHVDMSVHCEPLPSRSDASLARHCAALGFESAAKKFEYCADSAPSAAAYLRCARGTHRSMLSSTSLLRGTCTLRWHDRSRWAARQMLMRSAAYDRCVLQDTWHDVHDAVQRARPAYGAFSTVSSAIRARSSAMPAGSLSNVFGDSTAAPKGEIVPKWSANEGTGESEWGKVGTDEWERGLSGNGPKWDRGV